MKKGLLIGALTIAALSPFTSASAAGTWQYLTYNFTAQSAIMYSTGGDISFKITNASYVPSGYYTLMEDDGTLGDDKVGTLGLQQNVQTIMRGTGTNHIDGDNNKAEFYLKNEASSKTQTTQIEFGD